MADISKVKSCTIQGFTSWNSGWVWKEFKAPSYATYNIPCFGKIYSNSGVRALVIKFKTPTYESNSSGLHQIRFKIPLKRTKAAIDNWHCSISTTAPNFNITNQAQIPANGWKTNWLNHVEVNGNYETKTFLTGAYPFKSETTYYAWLYTDTPIGTSVVGYFGHNHKSIDYKKIGVDTLYTITDNTQYFYIPQRNDDNTLPDTEKPILDKHSYLGFRGKDEVLAGEMGIGANGSRIAIPTVEDFPYIYVAPSEQGPGGSETNSGRYYLRGWEDKESTPGYTIFKTDAYPTNVRKNFYIFRSNISLGKQPKLAPPANAVIEYMAPVYACAIHLWSPEHTVFEGPLGINWFDNEEVIVDGEEFNPDLLELGHDKEEIKFLGITSKADSYEPERGKSELLWKTIGREINGEKFYAIYQVGPYITTIHYLNGESASIDLGAYYYGTGQVKQDTVKINEYEGMEFIGWTNKNMNEKYDLPIDARKDADDNNIYAIYSSKDTRTYHIGNLSNQATAITYHCDDKKRTEIPAAPIEASEDFLGWSNKLKPTEEDILSWEEAWEQQDWKEFYAIYKENTVAPQYLALEDGIWKLLYKAIPYDSEWSYPIINKDLLWGVEKITFTINGTTYEAEIGMTWIQWVDSKYNTDGYRYIGDYSIYSQSGYVLDSVVASNAIEDGGTYTHNTSGPPDIPPEEPEAPIELITFTIGDTEYQAKEGMTWEEWVESEYNIDNYYYIDETSNSIFNKDEEQVIILASTEPVKSSYEIWPGTNYYGLTTLSDI